MFLLTTSPNQFNPSLLFFFLLGSFPFGVIAKCQCIACTAAVYRYKRQFTVIILREKNKASYWITRAVKGTMKVQFWNWGLNINKPNIDHAVHHFNGLRSAKMFFFFFYKSISISPLTRVTVTIVPFYPFLISVPRATRRTRFSSCCSRSRVIIFFHVFLIFFYQLFAFIVIKKEYFPAVTQFAEQLVVNTQLLKH